MSNLYHTHKKCKTKVSLTTAFDFEIIKLMLLDNYPEEAERLKRHEKFFEWVTWLIVIVGYTITYFPLGLPIHRLGANILFLTVGLTTFISYRILPFEKRIGFYRYTYKQKGFSIQVSDHLFASALIFLSGGINSPFWFIYLLALIAGAMYLPAWAMVVAGVEAILLYLLTVALLTPYFFGLYKVGVTAQMLIVPIASFFSVIMTYVVAKDLNIEIQNIRKLANNLKKKTTEVIGERNKLDTVVASVADGIFVLDKEKRITFINSAAQAILGLNKDNVLEKNIDEILELREERNYELIDSGKICVTKNIHADKKLFGPINLRIKTKFGSEILVNLTSSGIKEGDEVDIGCICTFHDISKEKELEEMKLDFVAMAAHELRTPLTAVRGYLSILIEEVSKKLTKEEKSWVEKAFVSTTNLSSLVENLLSISRIEMQSLKLELVETNWAIFLREIINNFQPQAKQKNIDLKLILKGEIHKISIDKFRMSEVMSNLLANAINYTNPGGKVELTSWIDKKDLITTIEDTGEGIPESALPHLFTKFFRVSGALEQGSKGTGLGLYISKAIIEMHQGKIWVKSTLGVGSIFGFNIPVVNITNKS